MRIKFLRRNWNRHSKLGKRRKKKQVWRNPKGRDNKMREKRKGYPKVISIGYKKQKTENKQIPIIKNIKDFEKNKKIKEITIGKMGKKKKIEIAKMAKDLKIKISNLNIKKILKPKKENKK
ncbi:50S ribosomal protein L32e [Candidatus Pacearchaeota archaeon]|jgi:large subunit ribosomal protein L32e|nr:50S ribosomal protein L32e [Candidatus Pacearchaeota archaeon]|tara:strand:+ start:11139 stop:11501 length:363 start_codon:yes stop_codon:yes gene_type:complete